MPVTRRRQGEGPGTSQSSALWTGTQPQAAPVGELSLFFFSCLSLSALTNAGQPGRTLPISKLNLQESAAGTFCIPPDCRPLCGVQLVV